MKETEVLRKLGFGKGEDLTSVYQLQDCEITYAGEKEVYFNLVDHKKRDKIIRTFASHEKFRKKTSKGPNIFPICYYAYGKIVITGWRAILKEKLKVNKHSNIPCEESWFKKKVKNKEKQAVKIPLIKLQIIRFQLMTFQLMKLWLIFFLRKIERNTHLHIVLSRAMYLGDSLI